MSAGRPIGPMTEGAKLITRMRRSYASARRTMKKALEQCTPGSSTYLQHIKALADLDAAEREEEIRLGLAPSNLAAVVKPEFLFISHVSTIPANRAELEKLLGKRMEKDCEELCYDEEDERIRQQFEEDFPSESQTREHDDGSAEHAE